MFFWDVKLTPSRPMKLHDVPTKVVKVDLQDFPPLSMICAPKQGVHVPVSMEI